jgi:alkanesulfonate monooxygenase SsuD/methylene tetrahydromethanopterin reductase-like flavin-dependent oxidoreductase (luciferase family)
LEEGVQIMRLLMTEDGVSFSGKHVHLEGATYRPRPVQQPHPPIWIGVHGERLMLPIAARHADVWHAWAEPETYQRKSELLDRLAADACRDPASIRRATSISLEQPDDAIMHQIESYAEIGVSYIYAGWPAQGEQRVEEYARRIIPGYR